MPPAITQAVAGVCPADRFNQTDEVQRS